MDDGGKTSDDVKVDKLSTAVSFGLHSTQLLVITTTQYVIRRRASRSFPTYSISGNIVKLLTAFLFIPEESLQGVGCLHTQYLRLSDGIKEAVRGSPRCSTAANYSVHITEYGVLQIIIQCLSP